MDSAKYAKLYETELLDHVIPFWMEHSPDKKYGGYFTCLLRDGRVYDTDKYIWLEARQVWTFSMLYDKVRPDKKWLDMALHGAAFLKKYGRDGEGDWYFSLTADGKPLVAPYNIFSDCFACMAFGRLFQITKEEVHAQIALDTFSNILKRRDNPKGIYEKRIAAHRPLRNLAFPMILSNLCLEMEHLLDKTLVEEITGQCIRDIMEVFLNKDTGLIHENVTDRGDFSEFSETRLINPGHSIEAMWFIMELGHRKGDHDLITKSVEIVLHTLESSWDEKYGGIYYFLDAEGYPLQQMEWDQKLWWVHLETIVALLKGYSYTGNERCRTWFEAVHKYTWDRFRDPEYGEWWGYLNRAGEVLLRLKGGKWKGCFHLPRSLYQGWKTLESISSRRGIS